MTTDLPYSAYGAIGAEPWPYPYTRKPYYKTQLPHNGELRGALAAVLPAPTSRLSTRTVSTPSCTK